MDESFGMYVLQARQYVSQKFVEIYVTQVCLYIVFDWHQFSRENQGGNGRADLVVHTQKFGNGNIIVQETSEEN